MLALYPMPAFRERIPDDFNSWKFIFWYRGTLTLDSSEPECESSGKSKPTTTAVPSSKSTGRKYHDGETFATFLAANGGEDAARRGTLTYSQVASHAKGSALPDAAPDSPMSAAASGSSLPGSFAFYDRATSCWKMCQRCLDGEWEPYSATWPRAGMTRSGSACQQRPLARRTYGTGCSLWPTPDANCWNSGDRGNGTGGGLQLSNTSVMLPTPTAALAEKKGADYARKDRAGGGRGPDLQTFAMMYPTPKSSAAKFGRPRKNSRGDLQAHVFSMSDQSQPITGLLSPMFVEWLIGVPIAWTDLEA